MVLCQLLRFPLLRVIPPLLHIHLLLGDRPDQAVHYHILDNEVWAEGLQLCKAVGWLQSKGSVVYGYGIANRDLQSIHPPLQFMEHILLV